jgi:hypothetical protein
VQIDPSTPAAVTERIRRDIEKWRKLVTQAGIRSE